MLKLLKSSSLLGVGVFEIFYRFRIYSGMILQSPLILGSYRRCSMRITILQPCRNRFAPPYSPEKLLSSFPKLFRFPHRIRCTWQKVLSPAHQALRPNLWRVFSARSERIVWLFSIGTLIIHSISQEFSETAMYMYFGELRRYAQKKSNRLYYFKQLSDLGWASNHSEI